MTITTATKKQIKLDVFRIGVKPYRNLYKASTFYCRSDCENSKHAQIGWRICTRKLSDK